MQNTPFVNGGWGRTLVLGWEAHYSLYMAKSGGLQALLKPIFLTPASNLDSRS